MDINRTTILANAITTTAPSSHSASGTSFSTSSTHGNGLAANTLVSAGSTIVSTSNPYHLILENSLIGTVCSYCLLLPPPPPPNTSTNTDSTLRRCKRCLTPYYCSLTCQKTHWKAHKHECPVFAKLNERPLPGTLPTPVRALIEVLIQDDRGEPWLGLESHETDCRSQKEVWEGIVLQARGAVMYSGLGENELSRAVGLLCRMKTNSFRFTSPTASGILFDPLLAMANHSCNPNASLDCVGRTVHLSALRDIEEGEQVFISYIDEDLPVDERKAMLRERYFFDCGCERCAREMAEGEGDPA